MPIKTITQIRAETPTVTLTDSDLILLDQSLKTVAGTLAQLKAFVRPANATTTTGGLMSSADKTKLGQIPTGATANQTDAYLLDRANHTGTQSIGTVTNLQTELNKKLEIVTVTSVVGLQDALDTKVDAADVPDVTALTQRVADNESDIAELDSGKLDKNNPAPTGGFSFPKYTFANKPSATTNNGRYIEITDSADGIVLARSNGTEWMKIVIISSDPVEVAP